MTMARLLLKECLKTIKPPPKLTVAEWADEYRFLSPESSAEPGKFSTNRTPYIKEIMNVLADKRVKKVAFMASAQVGKTEFLLNVIGYFMDYDPCPMLLVQPTDDMAQAFSKDRLSPMLRDTPKLKGKLLEGKRKRKDQKKGSETILHKKFPGGHLTMIGSNAPSKLASRPIRVVLIDESDRMNISGVGAEGDPIKLAEKRTKTFWNKKVLIVSTPTVQGKSQIEREYENSDQRKYYIPCPHCGEFQILEWKNIKWEEKDYNTASYYPPCCGERFPEERKLEALRKGEWRANAPLAETAGFHINELYSPWVKFKDIVKEFIEAKKGGPTTLRTWVNTSLGETWKEKEGDVPQWKEIYSRRETYKIGSIPDGVRILTAGIDVQKDRIECEVVGWGNAYESWSIDYIVKHLDTSNDNELISALEEIISNEYEGKESLRFHIAKVAVDSGYNTQTVYNAIRIINNKKLVPIKGSDTQQIPISLPKAVEVSITKGRKIKKGVNLYTVGSSILKNQVYGFLKRLSITDEEKEKGTEQPIGLCHFPSYGEEYFKMLTAEIYTSKTIKGFKKYYWEKTRDRNEALDCRVYALACLDALGYKRWTDEKLEEKSQLFQSASVKVKKIIKKKKKKKSILSDY